jgi:prevent-host-death family protein
VVQLLPAYSAQRVAALMLLRNPILALRAPLYRRMLGGMQILPVSKVRDKLNDLVDAVAVTHEQITITKNGSPAAVLVGADEWESLQETLFWLSKPGILDDLAEARRDLDEDRTFGEDDLRAEFGIPRRDGRR